MRDGITKRRRCFRSLEVFFFRSFWLEVSPFEKKKTKTVSVSRRAREHRRAQFFSFSTVEHLTALCFPPFLKQPIPRLFFFLKKNRDAPGEQATAFLGCRCSERARELQLERQSASAAAAELSRHRRRQTSSPFDAKDSCAETASAPSLAAPSGGGHRRR